MEGRVKNGRKKNRLLNHNMESLVTVFAYQKQTDTMTNMPKTFILRNASLSLIISHVVFKGQMINIQTGFLVTEVGDVILLGKV
jgi:hypothetical protein